MLFKKTQENILDAFKLVSFSPSARAYPNFDARAGPKHNGSAVVINLQLPQFISKSCDLLNNLQSESVTLRNQWVRIPVQKKIPERDDDLSPTTFSCAAFDSWCSAESWIAL